MKKTNKILSIVLLSLLAVGLVSAILVPYFGQRTTTINVESPIDVEGETTTTLNAMGGGQVKGSELTIVNKADFEIDVSITSTDVDGVEMSYIGTLELTDGISDGDRAIVEYTLVGNKFTAEVIDGAKVGYVLIYYKDRDSECTAQSPVSCDSDVNKDGKVNIQDLIITRNNLNKTGNAIADVNKDGIVDMQDLVIIRNNLGARLSTAVLMENVEGDLYNAKIWYVPLTSIKSDNTLDWDRYGEFLYETELIQYNKDGKITMFPHSDLTFYPLFKLSVNLEGELVIITTIDLFEE